MVGGKDDDRILIEPAVFQRLQNLADLVVEIGNIGGIGAAAVSDHFRRQLIVAPIRHVEKPFGVGILLGIGDLAHRQRGKRTLRI